jgi:hypothetical protein
MFMFSPDPTFSFIIDYARLRGHKLTIYDCPSSHSTQYAKHSMQHEQSLPLYLQNNESPQNMIPNPLFRPAFAKQKSVCFETRSDGQYHTYEIDLNSSPHYKGAIKGLRLDPVSTGNKGNYIKIEYIS